MVDVDAVGLGLRESLRGKAGGGKAEHRTTGEKLAAADAHCGQRFDAARAACRKRATLPLEHALLLFHSALWPISECEHDRAPDTAGSSAPPIPVTILERYPFSF
jgi:hypothetical protein